MSLLTGHPARLTLPDEPGLLDRLLDVLSDADLRGRGGAAFPTATKIASARGRRPRLIVNACDGEPLVAKDELLLRVALGLVADGAALIARAVDAREVVLAVHAGSRSESYGRSLLAQNGHLWSGARLLTVPARYVSSEATALAAFANGRRARPQDRERPMTLGDRDATSVLVLNAETVAQVALLWSGQLGPLTRLVTVTGAVDTPAVLEVDDRVTVAELVARAGGPIEVPRAVLLGGFGGSWLPWALAGTSLRELPALGHVIGAGLVQVLGQRCPVPEVGQVLQFLAAESAGQCGPCMFGLPAIADDWDQLADPRTAAGARDRLERRLPLVEGRGACRHPDGAVRHAVSALQTFGDHLSAHAAGYCDAGLAMAGAR